MPRFSSLTIDKRRRTYVRLIGEIHEALNQALAEEHQTRGLTKADIARLLGKNRAFVTRKLNGSSNMTLETLADLAYALNRPVRLSLPERVIGAGSNARAGDPQVVTKSDQPALRVISDPRSGQARGNAVAT